MVVESMHTLLRLSSQLAKPVLGNDDYFMHNNPGCPDLAHNPVVALPVEDAPGLSVVPDANGVIYFNDFEATTAALPEWSIPLTDTTPIGARRFLGQFGNDGVVLTLRDLPVHTGITLSFDLFVLQQWHGTRFEGLEEQGFVSFDVPDTWEVRVIDGPTLLQTTFSNHFRSISNGLDQRGSPTASGGRHTRGVMMDGLYRDHRSRTVPSVCARMASA
jgi:hypothetical protein